MTKPFDEGYLVAGADNNDFPDKVTAVGDAACLDALIPNVTEVYMRFYLKFKSKNSDNIKAEFMRTYKADVTYKENSIYN